MNWKTFKLHYNHQYDDIFSCYVAFFGQYGQLEPVRYTFGVSNLPSIHEEEENCVPDENLPTSTSTRKRKYNFQ